MRSRQGLPVELAFSEYLDANGLVGEEAFRYSLDWLLEMHRRYGQPVFSLIGLRLANFHPALMSLGGAESHPLADSLVNSLVDQLVDIIREPDRCSRCGEDTLWLLLPNTDKEGLKKVMQRLSRLPDLFEDPSLGIELRMKGIAAPLDLRMDEDAGLLMKRVAAGFS